MKFQLICDLITPIDKDDSIDYKMIDLLVGLAKKNDNDSISLFSLIGEGPLLSIEEKENIINYIKNIFTGRIYVNIYEINIERIEKQIDAFIKLGISDIILRIPNIYQNNCDGIYDYYYKIVNRYKNINFIITDYQIKIKTIRKIQKEIPQVKGIIIEDKYSFDQLNFENNTLSFFIENCENIYDFIDLGIDNFICCYSFYFGKLFKDVFNDYRIGFKNKFTLSYLKLVDNIFKEIEAPINVKYFLYAKGYIKDIYSRLPNKYDNKVNHHFELLV